MKGQRMVYSVRQQDRAHARLPYAPHGSCTCNFRPQGPGHQREASCGTGLPFSRRPL